MRTVIMSLGLVVLLSACASEESRRAEADRLAAEQAQSQSQREEQQKVYRFLSQTPHEYCTENQKWKERHASPKECKEWALMKRGEIERSMAAEEARRNQVIGAVLSGGLFAPRPAVPIYQAPQPQAQPAPRNCTSTRMGNSVQTNCY